MPMFRERSLPIEAVKITQENYPALKELEQKATSGKFSIQYGDDGRLDLLLEVPGGTQFVPTGDYIALHGTGQLHAWPAEIFDMVYEPAG